MSVILAVTKAGRRSEVDYLFIRRVLTEMHAGSSLDEAWAIACRSLQQYEAFWPERTPELDARITDYQKRAA